MAIANGQAANATNLNAAFVSKSINSTTLGVVDLFNTLDVNSGARVQNVQQAINEIFDAVGMAGLSDLNRKVYSSTNYVANGDDRKVAIGKLDLAIAAVAADKLDKPVSGQFAIVNNTNDQDVTDLIFDMLEVRSARVEWTAYRKSTDVGGQVRVQSGSFMVYHDDTNWRLSDGPMTGGFDAGVIFDVVPLTGQIQIDADDNGGTPDTMILDWAIVHTVLI